MSGPIPGISIPADAAARAQAASAEGSFELKSKLYTDAAAYAFYIKDNILGWRYDKNAPAGFNNKLDYIQALLRGTGYSKGNSQRGVIDTEDIAGLKKISSEALVNGVDFLSLLEQTYKSGNRGGQATFSKSISTAIRLKDAGDAKKALSDGYYMMFGQYPTQELVDSFMKEYNAETKRQTAKTTTSTTTTPSGSGVVTTSNTVTGGEGFTEAEQSDFLANYLVKNFNFEKSDTLGGQAKSVYDDLIGTYRNNYIPQPEFSSVVNVIKDVLSTGDSKIAQQKLDAAKASVRQIAAKQYVGAADLIASGMDLSNVTRVLAQKATTKFGRTVGEEDPLVKAALNYKDEKGNIRIANDLEFNQLMQSDKRYASSPDAIDEAVNIATSLRSKLGR